MNDREHCHRCGLPIKPGNETMLEYNNRTGEYLPEGAPPVSPPEDSLGGYFFGPECKSKPNAPFNQARRERNEERR